MCIQHVPQYDAVFHILREKSIFYSYLREKSAEVPLLVWCRLWVPNECGPRLAALGRSLITACG